MSTEVPQPARAGLLRRIVGSIWLRLVVTLTLLAVVAAQIDWAAMERRLSSGHPVDFALAVAVLVLALGVGAWRWQLLLRDAGVVLGVGRLLRVYAVSTFSNSFLPTSVGGDVARVLLVARRGSLLTRAAMTVLVDRVAGLVGLVVVAWLAFALDGASVPAGAQSFLAVVTLAMAAGTAVAGVFLLRGAGALRGLVPQRMQERAQESWSLLRGYARSPSLLVAIVLASIVFQALVALQLVMLASAIDVELPFATAAVALALVTVVTLIPVSIGGFGVREGTYVVLLGGASIAATDATLISVLTVAALFFASLPGAYLLARGGLAPTLEPAPR